MIIYRERNIDLLFHSFMYPLTVSYMCPDWGSNPQPWGVRTTLQLTEPHGQGLPWDVKRKQDIQCHL